MQTSQDIREAIEKIQELSNREPFALPINPFAPSATQLISEIEHRSEENPTLMTTEVMGDLIALLANSTKHTTSINFALSNAFDGNPGAITAQHRDDLFAILEDEHAEWDQKGAASRLILEIFNRPDFIFGLVVRLSDDSIFAQMETQDRYMEEGINRLDLAEAQHITKLVEFMKDDGLDNNHVLTTHMIRFMASVAPGDMLEAEFKKSPDDGFFKGNLLDSDVRRKMIEIIKTHPDDTVRGGLCFVLADDYWRSPKTIEQSEVKQLLEIARNEPEDDVRFVLHHVIATACQGRVFLCMNTGIVGAPERRFDNAEPIVLARNSPQDSVRIMIGSVSTQLNSYVKNFVRYEESPNLTDLAVVAHLLCRGIKGEKRAGYPIDASIETGRQFIGDMYDVNLWRAMKEQSPWHEKQGQQLEKLCR